MSGAGSIRVVLVEDDAALRDATGQSLALEGFEVQAFDHAPPALKAIDADFAGVVVSDIRLPGMDGLELFAQLRTADPDLPVILMTGHGDVAMAVEAMKNGAADFLAKPYSSVDLVRAIRSAAAKRALVLENRRLREALEQRPRAHLLGSSDTARSLASVIEAVARSDIDVVIDGESGTGRSFTARLIHDLSPRSRRPFVTVDGGILAHDDADLLLFGREPGAGLSRTGMLERANGGTLFLDDIPIISQQTHVRLLAALDSRSILPLGADKPRRLDVRIVVAALPGTSPTPSDALRSLEQRLTAVRIGLPRLVERRADIAELFRHFVREHERELGTASRPIGEAEWAHIQTYHWPGNIRELRAYARAFVLGLSALESPLPVLAGGRSLQEIVSDFERSVLDDALRQARGNVADLQRGLQTPRKTLYDKLTRHGLKPHDYR